MIRVKMINGTEYEVKNESWTLHGLSGDFRLLPKGGWQSGGLFPTRKGAEILHERKDPDFYIHQFTQLDET